MDTNYIIETKNLTKQYGSQKSVADLNIHVKRGRIYGLLGRNGAGKTTTMKMLLGLTKPTSGEVKIWGKSLPIRPWGRRLLPTGFPPPAPPAGGASEDRTSTDTRWHPCSLLPRPPPTTATVFLR